jgi:hypothetical protein
MNDERRIQGISPTTQYGGISNNRRDNSKGKGNSSKENSGENFEQDLRKELQKLATGISENDKRTEEKPSNNRRKYDGFDREI